ncbi:fructosamine kinase family protein [Halomonas sp. YLGW01]|uniref:fructosamine kinase family protein n=1 Tax=Halomonas sp. YLGW01 TaxID=2773308 RepID=UPI00177F9ED0|nr:fructosamine kinase family protein [Halomonas sp. YLGW01]
MDDELAALLKRLGLTPSGPLAPLSGGDIAEVARLETRQGAIVVKRDDPARLAGEAEGLCTLHDALKGSALRVPEVLGQEGPWLVMEALSTARPSATSDTALGEGLRALHGVNREAHGWPRDNACGHTPQPNAPLADGRAFQRERRLMPLAKACHEQGLLERPLRRRLEAVAEGLESWLPDAPASLLHGDLWSGNVLHTDEGPALIDPAVYAHYPEVDLAMLTLFGTPSAAFFEAYWNGHGPGDWPRREALFQLYPLLNHLLMFGSGYRGAVERVLGRLEMS